MDAVARQMAARASREANAEEEQEVAVQPAKDETEKEKRLTEKENPGVRQKAITKAKASKKFQQMIGKRAHLYDAGLTDSDDPAEYFRNTANLPNIGQFENCQICEIRFTVTAYSRTGPDGGLLCVKCTKELDDEDERPKRKRQYTARFNRRQIESGRLDGVSQRGARDLVSQCVSTLVNHAHQAEDFGNLPMRLVDKLSQLLSKKRLLDSRTLNLFLKPDTEAITVYDGAKLSSDDYTRIFQLVPTVKHLRLKNAIQFKGKVTEFLTNSTVELESFSIHGANLIDDDHWTSFLIKKGSHLRTLKVYYTDVSFGNDVMRSIKDLCPDLVRLKISHNQQVTDDGLRHITGLHKLQHLSLEIYKETSTEPYVEIINTLGKNLKTLSLRGISYVGDSLLEAIHNNCTKLSKLRLTRNETFTDAGFVNLFTNWTNPALRYVDLGECRHLDTLVALENPDKIGLCSDGFEALMAHSGRHLQLLNILSCRHITKQCFETVFGKDKEYPELDTLDVSFCWGIDDFVVGSIFRSCQNLKRLKVFGCFGVKDVKVPKGRVLLGNPNAKGMQIEGEDD